MNLNNIKMNVLETAPNGIVNHLTVFTFSQTDNAIWATYEGGQILKGFLVGTMNEDQLMFSYCQLQTDGKIDNGKAIGDLSIDENNKIKMVEQFEWGQREGSISGINIYSEL